MEHYDKKKNNKKLFIALIIFLILSLIIATVQIVRSIPKKELISTKTFDIYEFKTHRNSFSGNLELYYSYIDEEDKINQKQISNSSLFEIIHLGEKNKVTIEYWGRNGKVSKVKLIKFYVTKETYNKFSKEFKWEYSTN